DRDGSRGATLRPGSAPAPVVQLAYERRRHRLWTLTPRALEIIDLDPAPMRRTVIATAAAGGQFAAGVTGGAGPGPVPRAGGAGGGAGVLEAGGRGVLEVDARAGGGGIVGRWPAALAPESAPEAAAGLPCGATARGAGALLLLPDRAALIVAADGGWWRIDRAS